MMARFFNILLQGFDWEGLDNRTLDPPITPKVLIREEEKNKLKTDVLAGARPLGHI